MADNKVRFTVEIGDSEHELDRLDHMDLRFQLAMDAVLTQQFEATQAAVHVISGSLKASGTHNSRIRRGVWEGEIIYGGRLKRAPTPAGHAQGSDARPRNPVKYAQIEQARSGGRQAAHGSRSGHADSHDFMLAAEGFEAEYEQAIMAYLRGDL